MASTHSLPHPAERPDEAAEHPDGAAVLDPAPTDWEQAPTRPPLTRWRAAGTALVLVLVAAGVWWLVGWLTAPTPPSAPQALAAVASDDPPAGTTAAGPVSGAPSGAAAPGPEGGAPAAGAGAGAGSDAPAPAESGPATVRVHVVGQVRAPGVVEVPAEARVADAVDAAGGPTRTARPDRINLAAPVQDGQRIVVPDAATPEAELHPDPSGPAHSGREGGGAGAGTAGTDVGATAGPGGAPTGETSRLVDLNRADSTTLQTLPGVGPAMAERIIAYREGVGPFTGLQDLDAVPGIGPATLDRLRAHVTW
ncbi:ComEA family DNA-binding protein [Micrococcus sp.]|uniref:ComEA family DNA-binding protein n=1 Tax=Micrococcus sp. TaxID=1271 RepID=UPI002A91111F|nr:ComEA family DNA-binding protein [Micrococcus sp.]MDY6055448.1 ComEA family DNA-binding protein [Micrococcus sp.]